MAVKSGFFNAVDHDKMYNAEDINGILDGIISDGILNTYGDHFAVAKTNGLEIEVGSGRGWFKSTWIFNDDNITLTANANTSGAARIDTVVIDVNKNDDVRANTILIVQGTSSRPALINDASHAQYPLADLTIDASGSDITTVTDRREEVYATNALVLKQFYPIGAIYMSVNNIEPSTLFGGVWEQISGKFLIGCGGTSGISNGEEKGSWLHTITVNELPNHNHYFSTTSVGSTAVLSLFREGSNSDTINHLMSWPWAYDSITDLSKDNILPASWNYPYGYQGTQASDQTPVVGRSPYATSQTILGQDPHYHAVNGYTNGTGNGNAMEIRPPYLGVYMWKRVS